MRHKTIIHVNQHAIKRNRKTGSREPVLTVKTHKTNTYGYEAIIKGPDGVEIARVVYRPDKPLACGAQVWIETHGQVETRTSVADIAHVGAVASNVQQIVGTERTANYPQKED